MSTDSLNLIASEQKAKQNKNIEFVSYKKNEPYPLPRKVITFTTIIEPDQPAYTASNSFDKFKIFSYLDIPKHGNGQFQKMEVGLFHVRNSAG